MKPTIRIAGAGAVAARLKALLGSPALKEALARAGEAIRREARALEEETARETGVGGEPAEAWLAPAAEAARDEVRAIVRAGVARALTGRGHEEERS